MELSQKIPLSLRDFGYECIPSKFDYIEYVNLKTRSTVRISDKQAMDFLIDKIDVKKRGRDLTEELMIRMIKFYEKQI